MSPCIVVAAALVVAAADLEHDRPGEIKAAVASLLRETARSAGVAPQEAVPRLVAMYRSVGAERSLTAVERRRLQERLRTRLVEYRSQLSRQILRETRSARRGGRPSAAGGGAVAASAAQLIDLIRSTIAPETWDVNGGRGTIRFYSRLNVLVVRQTAEVHAQIGGTLGQLRR